MKMQLIEKIYNESDLQPFLAKDCCENDICVTFDENILPESYVVIKVDSYYNGLHLEKTPASPDCLIIRKCENSGFGLTIVELKSISNSQGFELDNLKEKFQTCIEDFISNRFKACYLSITTKSNFFSFLTSRFTSEI